MMPVAHAALELHANQWLGVDFAACIVPCVVSVMNTGSVLHITLSGPGCQWLCILGLLLQPLLPPACLAKGRLPKYLRLLYRSLATGRIEKCNEKRNCGDIAQRSSESNRSAYRCRKLLHRAGAGGFPDCIMSTRLGHKLGLPAQNGIRQSFMKLIHPTTHNPDNSAEQDLATSPFCNFI